MNLRVSEIKRWLDSRNEKFFLILIVVFTAIWSLLTFNKTAPVTEGWFTVYADLILSGKMPYSDFELTFTPLYTYFTAGVNAVFGDHLIVWRIIGSVLFVLTGVSWEDASSVSFFSSSTEASLLFCSSFPFPV